VPFILEHGQVVGRLVYERLTGRPGKLYGSDVGSNYQAQGLKLSKHFRLSSFTDVRRFGGNGNGNVGEGV
jgi:dCTP deaminase